MWRRGLDLDGALAGTLERLGYGAVWVGGSPDASLAKPEELLAATGSLVVGTGIVNIWTAAVDDVAMSTRRLLDTYGDRFVLGVGSGHREASGAKAATPYQALAEYLDTLVADGVPRENLVLAALGPRVLGLARDRTAGAHPYLVTPEHTREARETLGDGAVLVPEQHVLLDTDVARARSVARASLTNYLRMANYRNSWLRLGFTEEDLAGGGSDRFVDAVVVHGSPAAVAARLAEHLDAGADQVAVQLVAGEPGESAEDGFARLAAELGLA
ncbi:TIGR03620 family F420-dependent LLM class oxidoreductase [Luteimicrobium xylanilyticum]|uniref:TIGR03620 family F420-dependent LLM class oxidoreductase n=1 Tax=Luteimicrobium xylanilyticum TaxID=1133546 RepID=UPI00223EB542|nr:TIGR03620 family F420-dependent LLM class oxidoreductase [Luteimicrobium xylanilyticum]